MTIFKHDFGLDSFPEMVMVTVTVMVASEGWTTSTVPGPCGRWSLVVEHWEIPLLWGIPSTNWAFPLGMPSLWHYEFK